MNERERIFEPRFSSFQRSKKCWILKQERSTLLLIMGSLGGKPCCHTQSFLDLNSRENLSKCMCKVNLTNSKGGYLFQ